MKFLKVGCLLVILGIVTFCVGVGLFTYRRDLFPGINTIGEVAIVSWLPMIVVGVILIIKNLIMIEKDEKP